METVSVIDYSEKKLSKNTGIPARSKAIFITPIAVIVTAIIAFAVITFSFLYFYPVVTIIAVLLIGLGLKLMLTRERLTFFDEQYAPDIFVEQIEKERQKKYVRKQQ